MTFFYPQNFSTPICYYAFFFQPQIFSHHFYYILVIGNLECRKFGKSKNGKNGNPKVQKFGKLEIRKFGKSEIWKIGKFEHRKILVLHVLRLVLHKFGISENRKNRRFGKTEIREIGKSERKGVLNNKRITGMSVSCFFTHTSGFPGLLAAFIVTGGTGGQVGRVGR